MKATLIQQKFQNSRAGSSLFYFHKGTLTIVLIYVDDILVPGNNKDVIGKFVKELNNRFALKDFREIRYFLEVETRNSSGMYLTQIKYISDLLERLHLSHVKLLKVETNDTHWFM